MIGLRQRNRFNREASKKTNVAIRSNEAANELSLPHLSTLLLICGRVELVLHVIALIFYVLGFLARRQLHVGVECDMTWSWPQFLPINVPTSSIYHLFKFVDARDRRHQSFLAATDPLRGSDWCGRKNETQIVLYIPGHWGSYNQARSLGAHGVQLTRENSDWFSRRAEHALANNLWTGVVSDANSFVYDVYSFDFLNQGGGLHGQFLIDQSEFIAEVIMFLVKTCNAKSVTLVAHSVGGYAARLTPLLFPYTKKFVTNIITLATPHDGLPFVLDPSVDKVISRLKNEIIDGVTIISICGGIRDEMIPPSTCFMNSSNAVTILASDIKGSKSNAQARIGMDHRAIVWCHGLLSAVREVIFATTLSDRLHEPPLEKLQRVRVLLGVKSNDSFQTTLPAHMQRFRSEAGDWKAAAMEAAMLYRLELFLTLFVLMGTMRCVLGAACIPLLVPSALSIFGFLWSDSGLQFYSILILTFFADGVYLAVSACFAAAAQSRFVPLSRMAFLKLGVASFALVFLMVEIFWTLHTRYQKGRFAFLGLPVALVLTTVMHLHVLLALSTKFQFCGRNSKRQRLLVSLILPTLPFLLIGKVTLIFWTERCDLSSWSAVCSVIAPIYIWLLVATFARSKDSEYAIASLVYRIICIAGCLIYGRHLLCTGCGFRVAHLLNLAVVLDLVETIVETLL